MFERASSDPRRLLERMGNHRDPPIVLYGTVPGEWLIKHLWFGLTEKFVYVAVDRDGRWKTAIATIEGIGDLTGSSEPN